MTTNYNILPEHMRDGMRLYIEQGIEGGSFMMAVLENNLVRAFSCADSINSARMRDFAAFLYMEAPSQCWGSREKVVAWIERHP